MQIVGRKKTASANSNVTAIAPPRVQGMPRFLTVDEVAALLRCKPRRIYLMVHQKRIPFRKAGRNLLFELGEIEQWTKDSAIKA